MKQSRSSKRSSMNGDAAIDLLSDSIVSLTQMYEDKIKRMEDNHELALNIALAQNVRLTMREKQLEDRNEVLYQRVLLLERQLGLLTPLRGAARKGNL